MAKTKTESANNCPTHGLYLAASALAPCPKCEREPKQLSRRTVEIIRALDACELRIKQSWMEMGRLLAEMQKDHLYRDLGHKTFDDFCESRGYGNRQAYRLIESFQAGTSLRQIVTNSLPVMPQSASQTRELGKVLKTKGPAAVVEVYEAAGEKPTAKSIRAAVKQRQSVQGDVVVETACDHAYRCEKCGDVFKARLA